ncbi:MAG TPA: hypothetical protein VG013_09375 [Gemmataceae bacterium]|nr:hypothetical protein [Gemmataceae bacterium]
MAAAHNTLRARLRQLGRRALAVGAAAGLGSGLATALLLLVGSAWLDLLFELSSGSRVGCDAGAVAVLLGLVLVAGWQARRTGAARNLARRLDRVAETGGEVQSGVDLFLERRPLAPLSAGLSELAIARAGRLAGDVPNVRAVPAAPAYWSFGGAAAVGALIALAVLGMPGLARTQWLRFSDPYGDHPPFSRVLYQVEPGDARVVYGSGLDIRVTTSGAPVEQVSLVLESDDAPGEEILPLFPEPGGTWCAALSNITAPSRYYARSHAGRSQRFRIDVLTVPQLQAVRFRISPPTYTHLPDYEGPVPQGGLAGLPGTRVRVWATSNRPLSGGSLEAPGKDGPLSFALEPTGPDSQEATGSFRIHRPGKLHLRVTDTAGQMSREAFTAPVALLTDERPFVRLIEPPAQSYATPDTGLPIVLSAEDDYGISRVQLFRSLNDSRALPMDVAVPAHEPPRWSASLRLPLASYGLTPGDEIKLFARVEDNDPAGPKGSESSIAVVRIISQEDFERLVRAREGMEVFLSKYRQSQRRLAALAEEADRLRKKSKNQPGDTRAARQDRAGLKRLSQRLRAESEALRQNARRLLPYDLDKALSERLEQQARRLVRMARELESLAAATNLTRKQIAEALDRLQDELSGQKRQLERETIDPLELLAVIYPLIEDAARFVILYQRQQALAERLRSLKERDRPDDAAMKSRMRDLEAEQVEVRTALARLLDDIDDHLTRLPDDRRLDGLRRGAADFVRAVRGSGAAEAMAEAEAGLADFSGRRGYRSAQRAADILARFVARCQPDGIPDQAKLCLKFQPALASGLGATVEQLLAEAGLASGAGLEPGSGSGSGGYSMRRSTLENIGLYGGLPTTGEPAGDAGGRRRPGPWSGGRGGGGARAQQAAAEGTTAPSAAGAADSAIPALYRRRVAEYFRRIADEAGEK